MKSPNRYRSGEVGTWLSDLTGRWLTPAISKAQQHAGRGAPEGDVFLAQSRRTGVGVLAAHVSQVCDQPQARAGSSNDAAADSGRGKCGGRRERVKRVPQRDARGAEAGGE